MRCAANALPLQITYHHRRFQDQVFQEFGKQRTTFDIVVGDSQWLDRGAATVSISIDLWPSAGARQEVHRLVPPEDHAAAVGQQARRLHRQRRDLESEAFKKASPYNRAFAESMDIMQDFWKVPSYNELIAAATQRLGEALDGKTPPKEALATLADEHEKILNQSKME
jgi:hypothetical protein